MRQAKAKDIDAYIAAAPANARRTLQRLRETIHKAAPRAQECISYGMPAFRDGRVLVYFSLWKRHIGLYPTSSGIAAFKKELTGYKSSKGAVQFPLDEPLPVALITKIVRFRVRENAASKKKPKVLKLEASR